MNNVTLINKATGQPQQVPLYSLLRENERSFTTDKVITIGGVQYVWPTEQSVLPQSEGGSEGGSPSNPATTIKELIFIAHLRTSTRTVLEKVNVYQNFTENYTLLLTENEPTPILQIGNLPTGLVKTVQLLQALNNDNGNTNYHITQNGLNDFAGFSAINSGANLFVNLHGAQNLFSFFVMLKVTIYPSI